jgi:thiol-disulfide isomerase/thioredoxin
VPGIIAAMVLTVATVAAANAQETGTTLRVGDTAPAITVAKWVKGTPVTALGNGKVNVVEFWATWCGPCKVSIPHLTELAKKYQGKVTFTGVSVWERDPEYLTKVAKFVQDMGPKMDYNVAADDKPADGSMATNWMKAAGQDGIPTAFVIGKDQKIAWIGHPMDDSLPSVLDQVLAGTFDAKAEAAKQAKQADERAKQEAEMAPIRAEGNKVVQLAKDGKTADALSAYDAFAAAHPQFALGLGVGGLYPALLKTDETAAYGFAKKLAEGPAKDNAGALNDIAWGIVENQGGTLKNPDYDTALALANKAAALTKNADPTILDTLAYAQFKKGNVDKAIEIQQKAIALLDKMPDADADMKKELNDHLALFKAKQ